MRAAPSKARGGSRTPVCEEAADARPGKGEAIAWLPERRAIGKVVAAYP